MAKEVTNRSSEGVRAQLYPRTDFPQQGWIGKATGTGTYYEAITGFGWWSETQSFRPNEKTISYGTERNQQYAYYQTNPQQGWLYKPIVNGATNDLYEANKGFGWWSQTQLPRTDDRSTYARRSGTRPFYQTEPQQGWLAKPVLTLYEAYTGFGWFAQTQVTGRTLTHPVRTDGWYQDDTVFTVIISQYDPAVASWIIPSERYSIKNDKPNLTESQYPVNAWSFAAAMPNWVIPSQRQKSNIQPVRPGFKSGYFVAVYFDPSTQQWHQATSRTRSHLIYRRDTNVDQAWLTVNLPPAPTSSLCWRVIRGNDPTGQDDWFISYQG